MHIRYVHFSKLRASVFPGLAKARQQVLKTYYLEKSKM